MRILHVGKYYPPAAGGMETFLQDLVQAQRAAGHHVEVLVHGDPLADDPSWLTRVPVQFRLAFAPVALGFLSALNRIMARAQPDVIHWHLPNTSAFWGLPSRQACAVPWILHWHSDVVVDRMPAWVRAVTQVYRWFEQTMLERAARVIVTSDPYRDASASLATWVDKCDVVPLGIPVLHASGVPSNGPPAVDASACAWTGDGLRLLSIGRLTYYKGFEDLIVRLAHRTDIEWVIAGDGELFDTLQSRVAQLKAQGLACAVTLAGHVSEPRKHQLLADCDVFCLPSIERTEAFGVTVLEAMAHGKACLVSDLAGSGLPWVVRSSGAGLAVKPGDARGWEQALDRLMDRAVRDRLGIAGRTALVERFGIERCRCAIDAVYASAVPEMATVGMPTKQPRAAASGDVGLIVIPAKNESQTIAGLVQRLLAAGHRHVLVIDDHSDDGTGELAMRAGAMVTRPALALGAWGGMQTGIRWGLRNGFDWVVTMDADDQHEVHEIQTLLSRRDDADVVIGAYPERASRLRRIAWGWFRWLSGFELRDLTSGFRLYNVEAMRLVCSEEATLLDYQDLGALLMIRRAGLTITEVPVVMNPRVNGISRIFHSWTSVLRYMLVTTLLCLTLPGARRRPADGENPAS